MSGDMKHTVAYSMYNERLKRLENRKCPREYCLHEYRAVESHPGQ